MNQRIIVTTNFDLILETAWQQYNPHATHAPQIITDISADIFKILRDDEAHIVKLHGSINEPKKLILSKSDYIQGAYGSWIYTTLFETLLLTHTFLFIGFSMNDPAISHLIEMYSHKYPNARPHYMFTSQKSSEETNEISRQLRKIILLNYSPAKNHRGLVTALNNLSKDAVKRRKELLLS